MNILFLTVGMRGGFGVDLVLRRLALGLEVRGHRVKIGCLETDGSFGGLDISLCGRTLGSVRELAQSFGADVLCAHASPFIEMLSKAPSAYLRWIWEHGDPTPELFADDVPARVSARYFKTERAYPAVDGVVAISEFVRSEIGFSWAVVVPNGCDHAPDFEPKLPSAAPLKVGSLFRMGGNEARYKGNALFVALAERLPGMELHVMGRGTAGDARAFEERGIRVHLNAPDAEKWNYLRGLDVFVSCSLWEGFNMPLVEAQAVGTLGLALDTGAHPETTPFVFSSLEGLARYVRNLDRHRGLLREHSLLCHDFVRSRYRWENAVEIFDRRLRAGKIQPDLFPLRGRWGNALYRIFRLAEKFRESYRSQGMGSLAKRVGGFVKRLFLRGAPAEFER